MRMNEFDESKHPRDKDGKFKKKDTFGGFIKSFNQFKERRNEKLKIDINFFGKSGKNSKNNEEIITNERANEFIPKEIFSFEGDRGKTKHHIQHRIDFGFKDDKQYRAGAKEFWNRSGSKCYFNQNMQRYYKYNEKTNEFISVLPDGTLKTYMPLDNKSFNRKIHQEKLYELKH